MSLIPRPTLAEIAASVVADTGGWSTRGVLVPTSGRIPVWVMAEMEAMATRSGQSRNKVMNLCLAAGLEAINGHLDEATRAEIQALRQDASLLPSGESGEI